MSVCGVSLTASGRLQPADATVVAKAHLYAGSMGLSVYPLIGGNLTALHAAMARADAFFAESVVLAATLTADGFNLDLEIGTQAITPKDTSEYLTFLDAWAVALEAAGLELQYDLGGCDDPYKSDFMCAPPAQPCSSLLRTADWACHAHVSVPD